MQDWLLLLIASAIALTAQPSSESTRTIFSPFTTEEYEGGAITSDIAEDRFGNLYFANEVGLLKYDGVNWTRMPATGQASYISSVIVDPYDRIWITSPKSIGFYSEDNRGGYIFNDLTVTLLELPESSEVGAIWKLYADGPLIYAVTASHVLRWNGSTWKVWHIDAEQRLLSSWVDETLYIHARGTGVYAFKNGNFELIAHETEAIASGVISIIGSTNKALICATISNGLFHLKNGSFTPLSSGLDETQILDAHFARNGYIALGTGNEGVLFLDPSGHIISQAFHDGAPVYQIFEDRSGSLWAATTGTILKIKDPSITQYPDKAYDITRHNGELYFTNGRELKYLPRGSPQTDAQTLLSTDALWDIQSTEEDLIYGGSKTFGIYTSEGNTTSISNPRHIAYLFKSWAETDLLYSNDPPTVSRWKRKPTGWEHLDSLKSFQSRALSLVELPNSKTLISSENNPLLLADWTTPDEISPLGKAEGLPEKFVWAHLLRCDETVVVISNVGLYRYDTDTGHFNYDPILGNDLGLDAYALESCPNATAPGWILHIPTSDPSESVIGRLLIQENGNLKWEALRLPSVFQEGSVEALLHEQINDAEILWVGGSKKLLHYDLSAMPNYEAPDTRLTRVQENATQSTYYNGAGDPPESLNWDYPQKTLNIEYAAPASAISVQAYETKLTGFESEWATPTQSTFREFTNLPHGDYTFEVRAVDEFGRKGKSAIFNFSILPPWYLTTYAYIGYTLGGIAFIVLVTNLYNRRLRKQRAYLKAQVAQRTAQLEERQQELTKANQAKQNFLASMSHEIRNPLNGIIGIVRILKDKEQAAGSSSEEMSYLDACSQHLNQLLGQTLDYSSLEAGKVRTQITSFNVNKLLEDVIQIHAESAEKKGLVLSLDMPNLQYSWSGDPVLLKQILINLVSNAIKYTPSGSVQIKLRYTECEDSVIACFEVTDTGPGIPKEKQSLIFNEFERLPESIEQQIPGTGLGLTISTEMARIIEGELVLDGNYTEGARFILKAEFGIDLYLPTQKKTAAKDSQYMLQGKRVLIADDMDFNRFISAEVLRSMGAEIDQAEDGLIALSKLNASEYDIAILDISMPNMSGTEVVEQFLKKHKEDAPQFIALSAYNSREAEMKCLSAGFDHFIEKPLDPSKLRALLQGRERSSTDYNSSTNDLLSYLSKNGTKSMDQLNAEYRRAFVKELDNLENSLNQNDNDQCKKIIHKLIGLNTIRRDSNMTELLDTLSDEIKSSAHKQRIVDLTGTIRTELDT